MNKEETMERKETVAERFYISTEREFVERLASLGISDGFESEQIRNIRSIAQDLLMARAASTPEAAGRGDERLMHELWVQGSRFETELRGALFLHPENWYAPALQQQLEQWDAIAGRYAQRFAAPPSAEPAAVSETKD